MTRLQNIAAAVSAIYLAIGLTLGWFVSSVIPAMNLRGALYYAAVWPGFVASGTLHTPSPPVPSWCFTFEEE